MPDPGDAESRAKGSWRSGRPSPRRARAVAQPGQREGAGDAGDSEPDIVADVLRERAGFLDVLFDDQRDAATPARDDI